MGDNSLIEWTDATWNPTRGCTKVSPGCDNCYAEALVDGRLKKQHPGGFGNVMLLPDRLDQPMRWARPRRVFVNSLSDLFHDDVPDEFIARVFIVMTLARRHTFQILTKRHGRMRSLLSSPGFGRQVADGLSGSVLDWLPGWLPVGDFDAAYRHAAEWTDLGLPPLPNVWLGVSVENQQWADIRIPALLDTPAAVRFISAEPLLGPVDLNDCAGVDAVERDWCGGPSGGTGGPHPLLDWVICGGESGPRARPMHPAWVRSLRDQCRAAGVAFHFKQAGTALAREWGAKGKGTGPAEWPEPFPREYPAAGAVSS